MKALKPIRSNSALLQVLGSSKPKLRKAILKAVDPNVINLLSECSLNVLEGNVKLKPCVKRELSKYKGSLRSLTANTSLAKKRRVLIQKGGFLPALLGSVLSGLLGTLLSR